MKTFHYTLLAAVLAVSACGGKPSETAAAPPAPSAASADAFIAKYNDDFRAFYPTLTGPQWLAATYITDDSQAVASRANEQYLEFSFNTAQAAKPFYALKDLKPETARALNLIRVGSAAPSAPAEREELAKIGAKMEANYGSGKWCRKDASGNDQCLSLQEIEKIITNADLKATPAELAEAWAGWHATAKPIRKDYQRFIELQNSAAKESGFANMGEMWRAGYDMSPAEFSDETERLWGQVKPLYDELHCYVRNKLNAKYGDAVVPKNGLIPAQLLGNMWAQSWGNLYPLMEPYQGVGSLDVTAALAAQREAELAKLKAAYKGKPTVKALAEMEHEADKAMSLKMTRIAEDFYTSLGFPALPDSFWEKSLLQQPRDRDVVCHASAWDMNLAGDVRIKQCIEPDEEHLFTIHHELGHIYYYLMYNALPPIFQQGAHDGFHEAIGDTITLSLTPQHLEKIGLVKGAKNDEKAVINSQMKLALDKITFLPWGKLVDQWRWKVMDGSIKPENYNAGWWQLREQYQGVAPPLARTEEDFDPGAKYHVPGNTPYTRYFLSFVIQFQFQKALCEAAGFKGPLHECDIYGNKAAGEKFMAMLKEGQSQPWPETLAKLTGGKQMDGSAIIEYFAPLMGYLKEQNQGQSCGWSAPTAASSP
ncbi:peptidase M2 family protein [Stagnimonas aquatica]|uniref:Peptidase M2 family protein n=1 Tax=Stagnimonas aquatica TaxID=2689987 RepID=A0A3N0V1W0_9GAMM|nr:M2 family metallopeptidase [Stagnimonas aquatica]ROH86534.1 peptidase M2 family protein [Stagnimonas aquatica]